MHSATLDLLSKHSGPSLAEVTVEFQHEAVGVVLCDRVKGLTPLAGGYTKSSPQQQKRAIRRTVESARDVKGPERLDIKYFTVRNFDIRASGHSKFNVYSATIAVRKCTG